MSAAETAFISTETFTQVDFKRWVESRPRADLNHYELIIDPELREVIAFLLAGGRYGAETRFGSADEMHSGALPGLQLFLGSLFS